MKDYIEVSEYKEAGYSPVVDFGAWRVAVLNYIDELEVQNIDNMQQHNETDEIFVLLEGNCTLFEAGDGSSIGTIKAVHMLPNKIYNVKKGVWHTHTLDKAGKTLIVENVDTTLENSPKETLSKEKRAELIEAFKLA